MDKLAKQLGLLDPQHYLTAGSEPLMPRLRWSDGISSLSDLEAKYRDGIMLTIVVLTLQDDGLALFTAVFKGSTACSIIADASSISNDVVLLDVAQKG